MTVIDLTLGERLRILRERAGLAVSDVADRLDVSRATLSRWEHDQIVPKRPYLREMASQYGVEFELLDPKAAGNRHNPDNSGYLDNIAGVSVGTSQRLTVISNTHFGWRCQPFCVAKRTVGVNHEKWRPGCHLLAYGTAGQMVRRTKFTPRTPSLTLPLTSSSR